MFGGKKVTHSGGKPPAKQGGRAAFGTGSVKMPGQPATRMTVPKDHKCKVCPGAGR